VVGIFTHHNQNEMRQFEVPKNSNMRHFTGFALAAVFLFSCSASQKISRHTAKTLLKDSALLNAHLGISLYDAASGKYLYNYQGDKYFVPASNVKLFSCYAGMKYLGDSLVGMRYRESDTAIEILPTGDPTFLQAEFTKQPVLNFLKKEKKKLYISSGNWQEAALGYGWAWDDYNDNYMIERNPFPIHGNMAAYTLSSLYNHGQLNAMAEWIVTPRSFNTNAPASLVLPYLLATKPEMSDTAKLHSQLSKFSLQRERPGNALTVNFGNRKFSSVDIPFYTDTLNTTLQILTADHGVEIKKADSVMQQGNALMFGASIKSQPTDSMLKPMMHRSDNFYAEQTLLMVSNEKLGLMNDAAIIDTLLNNDLKDLPQRPKWVDGSGLSRYNLFTPQSIVQLLVKMKNEFNLERLKIILATGGKGTLGNYYQNLKGKIFAKTGTLSNNCALSGYLITKKGKLLIFSVIANNYQSGAGPVRRAVEKWLNSIYNSN
jgi:serine-type D-Ala-D-Ala carboxypeptidase/endopeptidase (penicillin-binding protein 4)